MIQLIKGPLLMAIVLGTIFFSHSSCDASQSGSPQPVVTQTDVTAMNSVKYVFDIYYQRTPSIPEGYQVVEVIQLPPYLMPSPSEINAMPKNEQAYHNIMQDLASNPFAVLFQNTQRTNDFLLAIRGTAKTIEWFEDFRFGLIPFEPYKGNTSVKSYVHKGFFTVYKAVRDPIFQKITSLGDSMKSLTITGHSLGSAVAALLTCDILLITPHYTVNSFIFGTPRVGNKDFIDNLEKMLNTEHSLRILNNKHDKVPLVPPDLFGYETYPDQVFFSFTRIGPSQGMLADIRFWHNPYSYAAVLAHLYDEKNPLPSDVKIDN